MNIDIIEKGKQGKNNVSFGRMWVDWIDSLAFICNFLSIYIDNRNILEIFGQKLYEDVLGSMTFYDAKKVFVEVLRNQPNFLVERFREP